MQEPPSAPIDAGRDGSLRVLFVYAAARHSRPLSTRRERREIQRMFEREVYPHRKIEVDFLAHGVTRDQLREQVKVRSGYHVVHWSGHGHRDRLELAGSRGLPDALSGRELLDLFFEAGGFLPRLVFLSACHSGDVEQVKDWQSFLATARGEEPGARAGFKDFPERDIAIVERPGYTGAAHALLQGGVPSVIAMRYAIGDEYALALALDFYRSLFVDSETKSASAALTLARKALLARGRADAARFSAADPATPVLYGAEDPGLRWANERSSSLDTRDRRLHRIAELTLADHPSFVGRGWELANLGTSFISTARNADAKPVALITGLGGMGKTALAAEAFDLWNQRFEWVLLYQAKPNALSLDSTLRDLHLRLYAERGLYYRHVQVRDADAIHREADSDFNGPERTERLIRNLIRALRDEAILLVLDNFESNLKPEQEPGGDPAEPLWACQERDWDRCLALLATELVGAPSRVLITCRRQLAALAGDAAPHCLRVRLQPLAAGEAALYLREHDGLGRMIFGRDEAEKALAERLLATSRFHPLLMDRLARLATGGPELREQLLAALDAIEKNHDATKLPELFATERGGAAEVAYLEDALATSNDELIRGASPQGRRLLWMIAVANEPVELEMIRQIWEGPDLAPLSGHLLAIGLATEEGAAPDAKHPALTCHELVCERIQDWIGKHPSDRSDLTENSIRLAYAEQLEAVFSDLQHKNMTAALKAGRRALVYCVQAEAWERLVNFASAVVTGSNDPVLLSSLAPHLKDAAEKAPKGKLRWSCLAYLADVLSQSGSPNSSLSFYEQAAAEARAVTEASGVGAREAWSGLASILGNWAAALLVNGNLDAARQLHIDSAEARRNAGDPEISILGRELEALRIDVVQGRAAEALPQVESRLARVESWWRRHRDGQLTPEAPNAEVLARTLIGALDIARKAHSAMEDWEPALRIIDTILEVQHALERPAESIALARMNRANALVRLGRLAEAQAEMEACLEIYRNDPARSAKTLGSIASLLEKHGDLHQAILLGRRALALHEQLSDPSDRATSHSNLARYLEKSADPAERAEAPGHRLADLMYCLFAGLKQSLGTSMRNYAIRFRRAQKAGVDLAVPPVAELLDIPEFRPLEEWLSGQRLDREKLQAKVDQFLDAVRQAAVRAEPSEAASAG